MADTVQLGDKISLSGFSQEDGATMIVVRKMVGNHVKKLMEDVPNFQNIQITLKKVHAHPDGTGGRNEIHVKLSADKVTATEVTDFNLFVGLDKALKKIAAA